MLTVEPENFTEIDKICKDMSALPDYFDFRQAVDSYERGMINASHINEISSEKFLSVYCETNIVQQAARDGFEEKIVNNSEMICHRNRMRRQLQIEFWGLYSNDREPFANVMPECTDTTTNWYVHLASSYENGYWNGYRVVKKLKRPHVATYHYMGFKNLSSDSIKRAYVYGWYSACYDFFKANPELYYNNKVLEGMDPVFFYWYWISSFKRVEDDFLIWSVKKKKFVDR